MAHPIATAVQSGPGCVDPQVAVGRADAEQRVGGLVAARGEGFEKGVESPGCDS